jgi:ribonuclease Z
MSVGVQWQPVRFLPLLLALVPMVSLGQEVKVTLLGTGCPPPVIDRFGPSTLIEAGEKRFVIDAGRGATQRLRQLKVPWAGVQGVLLTHLHSDHVVGFPDLWLTGWLTGARTTPLRVWGPPGTKKMMSHLRQAYDFDIQIRMSDDKSSRSGVELLTEEISEGVVYDEGGVKITAFEVDHSPVKPAFGYRVDYAGRSVALSGDTKFSENLIRHAKDVDVLIHEVGSAESLRRAGLPPDRAERVIGHHTTPEQAGEVFSRVAPKLAVYSHIADPSATEEDLIPPTRKTYSGRLEIGEDLMVIEVGETITVRRTSGRP